MAIDSKCVEPVAGLADSPLAARLAHRSCRPQWDRTGAGGAGGLVARPRRFGVLEGGGSPWVCLADDHDFAADRAMVGVGHGRRVGKSASYARFCDSW